MQLSRNFQRSSGRSRDGFKHKNLGEAKVSRGGCAEDLAYALLASVRLACRQPIMLMDA